MGFGVTELIIILLIVLVLFGAKKLRNIGGDLGGAIKNFKGAMKEEENVSSTTETDSTEKKEQIENKESGTTIEGTVEHKTKEQV